MAVKTYDELTTQANQIKNETTKGANTANRVGTMLTDMLETQFNVKEYIALMNQTGTDNPTVTVLKNTLGGTPVWIRDGEAGYYKCTLVGAFKNRKTAIHYPSIQSEANVSLQWDDGNQPLDTRSEDSFHLFVSNDGGATGIDGLFFQALIHITVYQ